MALDILIVDDERDIRELVAGVLEDEGYGTRSAGDSDSALEAIADRRPSLVLLDVWLQGSRLDGLELLDEIKRRDASIPVLMISGHGNLDTAVAAIRRGAADFIEKPFQAERLLLMVGRATETERLKREVASLRASSGRDTDLTGSSTAINGVRATLKRVASTGSRVLIMGSTTEGKIEQAHGGTLFLDEIADMPLATQGRILRVLTDQSFTRVGGQRVVKVDVRVVSATARDLTMEIAEGRFREDLYYRLNVVQVTIPPLRERAGDIPALARHLLARIAQQPGLCQLGITDDALTLLGKYDWPGNVRQLQNALFRAAVLCEGSALTSADFPQIAALGAARHSVPGPAPMATSGGVTLFHADGNLRALEEIEADVIRLAIGHYRGRMTEVARRLGIGRSTLYRKLGELGIDNAAA